ncbi:MAG: V-type ATP synthase subunit I [Candidatus Peregrinibacteria bacterium]|nr:V-type ATP synthase subunit I [Candidatus Peregrinibacteria bacterium]
MAVVPMQKIGLLAHKNDKEKILSFLQEKGVLHLTNAKVEEVELAPSELSEKLHDLHYKVAELDFAIHFLAKFEKKAKGLQAMVDGDTVKAKEDEIKEVMKDFKWKPAVESCKKLEEVMVELQNEKKGLVELRARLEPWSHHPAALSEVRETQTTISIFATAPIKEWEALKTQIVDHSKLAVIEMDNMVETTVYFQVICEKSLRSDIEGMILSSKGELVELPVLDGNPAEELRKIDRRFHEIAGDLEKLEKEAGKETTHLKQLRILYDAYNWDLIQKESDRQFLATETSVVISGWAPAKGLENLKKDLDRVSKNFELFEMEPEEGESAPVLLVNKGIMKPFEAVTGIYGLPLPSEMDPTPYLAIFFIVFFGLALTDAIYGLLMFAIMFSVLRFLKIPKESQGLIRLLMYAGIVTFFAGALYGGWASLEVSQVPAFLTTVNAAGETVFIGQKISAITNPMGVLILSLILGYIQVLFGVIINFIHKFRHESKLYAMIDHFPWVFILSVIALQIMLAAGLLPDATALPLQYLLYIAIAAIVLTQGREKKNPIMKLISGVLGLYGLVGYLSDILSYSRLLALGLATSIIGLAVNTIAGMVGGVPYIGIVLAIIVLIGGHLFNIGINALGAFIHSGRLQFVEFFTKFLEGGGRAFEPLRKESRYVRTNE